MQGAFFAADVATRDGGMMQTLIMLVVALGFFYFILWRPEKKRRDALEKLRGAMKRGDRVVAMGIMGTVDSIGDTTVTLKIAEGKIEVLKAAITDVQTSSQSA